MSAGEEEDDEQHDQDEGDEPEDLDPTRGAGGRSRVLRRAGFVAGLGISGRFSDGVSFRGPCDGIVPFPQACVLPRSAGRPGGSRTLRSWLTLTTTVDTPSNRSTG